MTTAKGSGGFESCGVEAGRRAKRRSWSMAERRRIVEAALAPGASVAGVARAHNVNANLVFKWIRRSREGWHGRRRALRRSPGADASPSFVPVRLIAPVSTALKDAIAGEGGAPIRQCDPPSSARPQGRTRACFARGLSRLPACRRLRRLRRSLQTRARDRRPPPDRSRLLGPCPAQNIRGACRDGLARGARGVGKDRPTVRRRG